jgi:hypothetical protein
MENERGNGSKNVIIVILVVLLALVLITFVSYIVFITNTNGNSSEKEVEESTTTEEISEDEALKLLTKFDITDLTVTSYDEEVKFKAAIKNLSGTFTKYDCSDLLADEISKWENREDGYLMSGTTSSRPYFCSKSQKYDLYPYSDVADQFDSMYGSSISKITYDSYYYISKYNGYSYLLYADGTTGPNVNIDVIKNVKVDDDKLVITAYLENLTPYDESNFKVGDNLIPFNMDDDNYDTTVKQKVLTEYIDSVKCYDITFNIEKGNYSFASIKRSN